MQKENLEKYLDKDGKIITWPNTADGKQIVCEYLSSLFESGKNYTEREVTQKISDYHCFMNPTMLRRELIARKLMTRKPDGSAYWKIETKMQIRTATDKDLSDLLELIRKGLGDENAQEDFVRANLSKLPPEREAVFVADVDGIAAGFIHVEVYSNLYFGPVGNILGLAVKEEFRRQGFATKLLQAAENWSKEKGCIGMRLNSGGTRHGAHEFYRSQGYNNEKTQIRFIKMY